MNKKRVGGFTIIELLIVCAVVAILAAITIAFSSPSRTRAKDSRRVSDITQIQSALESYFAEQPRTSAEYPATNDWIDALEPDHIAEVPEDPSSSNLDYKYVRLGNPGKGYCLGAKLEASPHLERAPDSTCQSAGLNGYNYVIRR